MNKDRKGTDHGLDDPNPSRDLHRSPEINGYLPAEF